MPPEQRSAAVIERWKVEYLAEVEGFRTALVQIAARDGSVITWEDEQGWL